MANIRSSQDNRFYFGLQTNMNRPNVEGPGVKKVGKGVIFSRWGTRDLSHARCGSRTALLNHQGMKETLSVSADSYDWSAGTYRARLARYDSDSAR